MKILIDMNLSPEWVPVLEAEGWTAKHWSHIGNPKAEDKEILPGLPLTTTLFSRTILTLEQFWPPQALIVQAFFKFVFKMFCLNQLPLM